MICPNTQCKMKISSKWAYCPQCGKRLKQLGRTTQLFTIRVKSKTLSKIEKTASRLNVSRNYYCNMVLDLALTQGISISHPDRHSNAI